MIKDAPRLVLASASPRRRHILAALGLPFDESPIDVDERQLPGEDPEALAARLALAKACAGAVRAPDAVVLGADTVVALGSESLGKPLDAVGATQMLQRLRGREHVVITAIATARAEPLGGHMRTAGRVSRTRVWMRAYSDAEIEEYVGTEDPFDKAGAYAIQHLTFRPVERIDGCYLTVVGLPLPEVCELLDEAGLSVPRMTSSRLDALCAGCTDGTALQS